MLQYIPVREELFSPELGTYVSCPERTISPISFAVPFQSVGLHCADVLFRWHLLQRHADG